MHFVGLLIIQCMNWMKKLKKLFLVIIHFQCHKEKSKINFDKPLEIKAYQYDIVCNGIELSSGAIRNHIARINV